MKMEQLMNICTTVAEQPGAAHKQMMLAVEAVKVRNQHGFDLGQPKNLCVDGKNPLYEACRAGNIPLVKLFLSSGADLNVMDSQGVTPLYHAMASNHSSHKMVDFLLGMGSNPNLHSQSKCPLLASFYRMKIDTSLLLIKRGADVNNVILPSFCFVESVFALNSNLVMIASGVRFNLEEFDQLVYLAKDIIHAGLLPRTFYLHGRRYLRDGFTENEMSALWNFQCLCMAVGFRVDQKSIKAAARDIQQAIAAANSSTPTADSGYVMCLKTHLDRMQVMTNVMGSPLSLTRLCRVSIRGHLSLPYIKPSIVNSTLHLNQKIDLLPIPEICKNFLQLKSL